MWKVDGVRVCIVCQTQYSTHFVKADEGPKHHKEASWFQRELDMAKSYKCLVLLLCSSKGSQESFVCLGLDRCVVYRVALCNVILPTETVCDCSR